MQLANATSFTREKIPSNIKVKVLPEWIFKAIIRNKLNVVDIEEYSKIRSILSFEDLVMLEYYNRYFNITKKQINLATTDLFNITKLTPEQQMEYQTVRTLSTTDETKDTAYAKLSYPSDFNLMDDKTLKYRFIPTHNFVALVLSEGFIEDINEPTNIKVFIASYLEHCYFMASVNDVSQLAIFNSYLTLL